MKSKCCNKRVLKSKEENICYCCGRVCEVVEEKCHCEVCTNGGICVDVAEDMKNEEDITKKALKLGLNDVSMHVWQACCNKHGVGGTPKANEMYDKIMRVIIKEVEK